MSIPSTSFAEKLNMDFLREDVKLQAKDVFDESVKYPSGHYIVEVIFNRRTLGKKELIITSQDKEMLCLSKEWMDDLSFPVAYKAFEEYYDSARNCYNIGKYPGASVTFKNTQQLLSFSIPQIAIDDSVQQKPWDYGIPGIKVNYSGYVTKTNASESQVYGDVDTYINAGRWVTYVRSSYQKDSGLETSEATISTAVRRVLGNFLMGKTITSTTTLPNFMFKGIALQSDNSMRPWSMRGYAPIISGVVNSNATITVSQNGYILSSVVVPAGAYQLNDITPVSNGEITVTTEQDDGKKTVSRYAVGTLPSLLRANEINYNFAIGKREVTDVSENKPFHLGAVDYGLKNFTAHSAWILNNNYKSLALGVSKDMGRVGAISFISNYADSKFKNQIKNLSNSKQKGISHAVKYATSLTDDTNLQLLTYRYTGKNYVDFADYDSNSIYYKSDKKERYETILSQRVDNGFISLSGWMQTYRNNHKKEAGSNISYNTTIKGMDFSISGDYQKQNEYSRSNYMISMSLNIPFSIFDKNNYWTNSVNYDRKNEASFNSGFSGQINDRVNYSANTSKDRDSWGNSAYLGVNYDSINMGYALSQTKNQTTGSLNTSGSIVATRETGLLLSSVRRDTVAIANIKDLENIKFNGSPMTNRKGNTLIGVSPYVENDLKIDPEEVPNDIELLDSVYNFVPTDKSIVYREFKYAKINRYILRLKKSGGSFVPAGSSVKTDRDAYVGFVSNGGIVLLNLLDQPKSITVSSPDGEKCNVEITKIKPNANKVREITCQ